MLEQGYLTRAQYDAAIAEAMPDRRATIQPPHEDTKYAVLHVAGQAAGRRPARRRPAGRAGVRGRPEGPDDARPRAPARRRAARSSAWLPRPRRPARVAGRDRQQDRRGAGDGRRRRLQRRRPFNLATQGQRQPGSSFKPFVLADGAQAGHLARLGVGVAAKLVVRPGSRAASTSPSTTTRTPTRARPRSPARRPSPTTRSSPRSGIKVGHRSDRQARAPDGHPHAGLAPTRR